MQSAAQLGVYANGSGLPLRFRLFDNTNTNRAYNSPKAAPVFSINKVTIIHQIETYHWNNGRGAVPGEISLVGNRRTFGPWKAIGLSGSDNVPNVDWVVRGTWSLAPGNYTIVDSSVTTWSWNTNSGGAGFARVWGF